jgi:DNA-directed RNA polymerase subunit RPC12/RpoP
VNCKKTIAKLEDKIRCPYCGHRIFVKERPDVMRRVHAV